MELPVRTETPSKTVCSCANTWVLVVNNDFKKVEKYERYGNEADVDNLRRVFEFERHCKFAELANCNKDQIVATLSQQDKIIELFHSHGHDNQCDRPCRPVVFYLFVLSHGETRGRILTDHFKVKAGNPNNSIDELETYNTSDVWNSLANVQFLQSTTKILLFAPCRGTNAEVKYEAEGTSPVEDTTDPSSGWITSGPNKENFITFFSTVETTYANRNELKGTWFVQSICKNLDDLNEEIDILSFFTNVQSDVCQQAKKECVKRNIGQTPQLQIFASHHTKVCARHTLSYSENPSIGKSANVPDCWPVSIKKNGENVNELSKNISNSCALIQATNIPTIYNWGQDHHRFARGRAFIFHDDVHVNYTLCLEECFLSLGYDVKVLHMIELRKTITCKGLKRKFQNDGSLVLCTLSQLEETNAGLVASDGNHCVSLSYIVDNFSGLDCSSLIGKPKLFFFLDDGTKQDNTMPLTIQDSMQFTNVHAGVFAFVGVSSGMDEKIIEKLSCTLQSEKLKNGQWELQTAILQLIKNTVDTAKDKKGIKSQMISTLPLYVNFPPLLTPFLSKQIILVLKGATAAFLALLCLMTILLTSSPAKSHLSNVYYANGDDCHDYLLPASNSITIVDALALDEDQWSSLAQKCNEKWKQEVRELDIVFLINSGAFDEAKKRVSGASHQIKLVVLLGYASDPDSKLAQFCSMLDNYAKQCFSDLFKRMAHFHHELNLDVLSFWFYLEKSGVQIDDELLSSVHTSQMSVIANVAESIKNKCQSIHLPVNTYEPSTWVNKCQNFANLSKEVLRLFLPKLIAKYYRENYNPQELLKFISSTLHDQDCFAYKQVYLQMKNTTNALQLRPFVNKSKSINDKELCREVEQALLNHNH